MLRVSPLHLAAGENIPRQGMVEVIGHNLLVAVAKRQNQVRACVFIILQTAAKMLVRFNTPSAPSPCQTGLHVALLQFGFRLDILRVVMAILIHNHPTAPQVKALGRGQLVT